MMLKEELRVGLLVRCVIDVNAFPWLKQAHGQLATIVRTDGYFTTLEWDQPVSIGDQWTYVEQFFEVVDPQEAARLREEALDRKRREAHALKWL